MHAANARDLVPSAPDRPLLGGPPATLPIGDGRTSLVSIWIAAGPPSRMRVPTELSLKFSVRMESDGTVTVLARPTHADLLMAVTLALAGETRALESASRALENAGVQLPSGTRRWADALVKASLDARLPREQFVGNPSWMLMFAPREQGASPNAVLLDATSFAVQNIQAR